MSLFRLPEGLAEIAHFTLPRVQTWGRPDDFAYKEQIRQASAIVPDTAAQYDWFVFCIRAAVGESRGKWQRQVPDVENVPKLIVDAFTGLLYPDDNLHYVRGVQVEAAWVPDALELLEVWIYGWKTEGRFTGLRGTATVKMSTDEIMALTRSKGET
jgi:Holliday junction resolvase RusA-like endonuclease